MTSRIDVFSAGGLYRPVLRTGKAPTYLSDAFRAGAGPKPAVPYETVGNRQPASQNNDTAADTAGTSLGSALGPEDRLPEIENSHTIRIAGAVAQASRASSDLDETVVDVRFGNTILSNALLGYGSEDRIFLPLVQVARILDFNISANPDTGRISGWFLDEDRLFEFDPADGSGTIQGKPVRLTPDQYMAGDDGLYVDAGTLSTWFPVDFSYDFSQQSVFVDPREKLPFQERLEREQAMKQVRRMRPDQASLPLKEPDYQFIDPMFIDFGFSGNYKDTDKIDQGGKGRYYFLGRGDLGYMNSELYVTGDENNTFNTTRLTLMREDPRGGLLGPLNATRFSVGDIRIPSFPIVSGGGFERGGYVGSLPLNLTSEYDTTFFAGSLAPGWDVEIYRNGVLLDSQRVGSDGRYSFEEVPLYYGTNEFKLKFYGPQGQEREETESVVVGSSMIPKGESEYQVSLTQKDEKLFDPLDTPDTADKNTRRLIGRYRYGVGQNLSVQGGIQSQEINAQNHDYLNFGVQGNVKETFLSTDVIHDLAGGDAFEALAQKRIGPLDVKLRQQYFDNFTREGETDQSNKIESQTDISTFGILKGKGKRPDIPFHLTLKNTKRTTSDERVISTRVSAGLKNTYLNNYLQWKDDTGLPEDYPKVEGNADLTSYLGKLRLRANLEYDLYPESEVKRTRLSGLYALSNELTSELALTHDIENDDLVTGSMGLNWNNGKYILSPQVSYNSDDDLNLFLSFSTSFGMDKRSGRVKFTSAREADQGALSARVYHDKNNNKVFDAGDEPVSGAEVKADQSYKTAVTDENGIAFMTGLRKHLRTDITLKPESLEDPFWEPSTKGNSIVPRPGHVETLDIPVTATGEIDGTLYLEDGRGKKTRLKHAPVQLLDRSGKVVQEIKTEYDGFYLFMKVHPGDYHIRLKPEFETQLGIAPTDPVPVAIGGDGTVISGQDLVFRPLPSGPDRIARVAPPAGTDKGIPAGIDIPPVLGWESGPAEEVPDAAPAAPDPGPAAPAPGPAVPAARPAAPPSQPEKPIAAEAVQKTERPPAPVAAAPSAGNGRPYYGLHLSSYREMGKAVQGIQYQRLKHDALTGEMAFTVKKTDLGPDKGIWYRVFADTGSDRKTIASLGSGLTSPKAYAKLMSFTDETGQGRSGIHMASYRTRSRAQQGIRQLKQAYPDLLKRQAFTLQEVDLGPEKGIWHRIIATGFEDAAQASQTIQKLKTHRPYSKPMSIETHGQFTVHTASYRTVKKALAHLTDLVKTLGPDCPDQVSVRPVDLGRRGIWYRVVLGQFDRSRDAAPLAEALEAGDQYAKIMTLSMK